MMRHAPYGNSLAKEGIDAILTAAAYDQNLTILFANEGLSLLLRNQQSDAIQQKCVEKMLNAFSLYDINEVYVDHESIKARAYALTHFSIPTKLLSKEASNHLLQSQDIILSF